MWKSIIMTQLLAFVILFGAVSNNQSFQNGEGISNNVKLINIMNKNEDSLQLSAINAQFIRNFLNQDAKAHGEIIHKDFVCIESNGGIVDRATYLKNWATDFDNSGYKTFTYSDEHIRIFGDIALVRSKTIYTKLVESKTITGYTIYTDTYKKENGKWQCVQVQITPVK